MDEVRMPELRRSRDFALHALSQAVDYLRLLEMRL
jgi:hypothetical protein